MNSSPQKGCARYCFFVRKNSAGFTLLELLVVIAIIGILAAVVLLAVNSARDKANNTSVISQMLEYQKALALYYSEYGSYPQKSTFDSDAVQSRIYCFGDGAVGDCIGDVAQNSALNDDDNLHKDLHLYMSALPTFDQAAGGSNYSSPAYSNCIGQGSTNVYTSCGAQYYSLWFVLEGANEDCGRAYQADATLGGGTHTL